MAIALLSYYGLCRSSYIYSTRLFHEDRARELGQVGLEEALWALNQNTWTQSGLTGDKTWTLSGADRTLTLNYDSLGQGASGRVDLRVANYASAGPTWPSITATATITVGDGGTVTKTFQATTEPAPLFANAIASSNSYVSFVAGGTVDSWNSDPDNDSATAAVPYSFSASDPANYAAGGGGQR